MKTMTIGKRRVGPGQPCCIIGEVAQAHDGSLGAAHAFIDAIAKAGADAVKFQTHIADAESTPQEPWRVKFSQQDKTRFDYWKRMEFTAEQWAGLKSHADERGLLFLSSPFSIEAVELLERLGMEAWKIASGEVNNPMFLHRIADTGKPALLSSGMSSFAELDAAVELLDERGIDVALFQCTTAYPCPPEKVGLEKIAELQDRYDCPAGLSDHSGAIYAGLAAAALGANLLEIHVTLSREMFGPDVVASVTTAELRQLTDGVRFIEKALANPVDKDAFAASMQPLRTTFGKSVVLKVDVGAGDVLRSEHLTVKKPGHGIPANQITEVIGRVLKRSLRANTALTETDLEPAA